jgi:hypothetical protein
MKILALGSNPHSAPGTVTKAMAKNFGAIFWIQDQNRRDGKLKIKPEFGKK